jgi:hypothetical protein
LHDVDAAELGGAAELHDVDAAELGGAAELHDVDAAELGGAAGFVNGGNGLKNSHQLVDAGDRQP